MCSSPSASFFQIHYVLFINVSSSDNFFHANDFCIREELLKPCALPN